MSGSCILIVEEDLLLRTRSRDVIIGCPKADGGSVRGIHRRPPLPVHEMATAQVRPSGLVAAISIEMIQRFASPRK